MDDTNRLIDPITASSESSRNGIRISLSLIPFGELACSGRIPWAKAELHKNQNGKYLSKTVLQYIYKRKVFVFYWVDLWPFYADGLHYLLKLQIFSVAFNLSLENSRIGNSFQHFSPTRNCLLLLHPSWFLSENWFYYCFSWINFGIIYDSYCVWVFLLIRYASPDLTVCISTRVQIRGGGQNII